jgi:ABC-type multidrug transport system fused ATPase/permease subunit
MTVQTQAAPAGAAVRAAGTPETEKKSDQMAVLRRMFGFLTVGADRNRFIVGSVLQLFGILALILVPFFSAEALDVVSSGRSPRELAIWSALAIAAGLIALGLSYLTSRTFARLATNGLSRLQRALFDRMQMLSISFFDRNPSGDLISRVNNDSESVALFFENSVSMLISSVLQIVLVGIIVFVMDWKLAIVALLVVPVLFFFIYLIQQVSVPAFAQLQEQLGDLSGFQEETISGHKTVINSGRQQWAADCNEERSGKVFHTASKANFMTLLQTPITMAMNIVQTVIILVVGSLQIINGHATLGDIMAFTGYAAMLATALSNIANLAASLQGAVAGGRRVFAIIDEQPTVLDVPDARNFEFKGGNVAWQDVDFSYLPGRKILKHNTFEAQPGQKIGLCGPTGAGKSTIINLLTRYYDIDSGTILIDGQDIGKLTQVSLRKQIGVVLQEAFLFTDTVMNNLKYAREWATDEECIEAARQANAHDMILTLPDGYNTVMTERGANLSQGQRQMITIARAFVANPKMMILDEATSNVDTRTEKLVQEGLARLMAGRTSFVIAHRLSTIRDSSRILVINAGEIVEQGTHDELMAMRGFYHRLYMSQFKGKAPA